jgi:hypothetical protein
MVLVAELVVDHHQPLGIVGQRQFPGHADAAVQLDALLGHPRADAADAELGRRQRALARRAVGVDGGRRVDDGRAGLLDLEQQVGHAVLQRLEAADQQAELLARAQVLERGRLGGFHRAERFGAQRQHTAADGAFERRGPGLRCPAVRRRRSDFHVGGRPRIAQRCRLEGHRARRECSAVRDVRNDFVVHRARCAGGDHEEIRLFALLHDRLGALEHPGVAAALGARLHAAQFVVGLGFVMGQRGNRGAADDLCQQALLRVIARNGDDLASHHGAQQWFDHQAAAQRLEDHRDIEAATAEAAIGFAEQRAGSRRVRRTARQISVLNPVRTWRCGHASRRRIALR